MWFACLLPQACSWHRPSGFWVVNLAPSSSSRCLDCRIAQQCPPQSGLDTHEPGRGRDQGGRSPLFFNSFHLRGPDLEATNKRVWEKSQSPAVYSCCRSSLRRGHDGSSYTFVAVPALIRLVLVRVDHLREMAPSVLQVPWAVPGFHLPTLVPGSGV